MAELPVFRRSVGIAGGDNLRQISPGQTGMGVLAAGLGVAAEGAFNVASALDEIQKTKEDAWITRTTGEAAIWSDETARNLEKDAPEGAPGHTQAYQSEWGEYSSGLLKAAPSKRAREALSQQLTVIGLSETRRRGAFQAQAELAKRDADFSQGISSIVASARTNPDRLPETINTVRDHVAAAEPWLARQGIDVEAFAANLENEAIESAGVGFAEGGDFDSARMMVDELRGRGDDGAAMALDMQINAIEDEAIRFDDGLDFQQLSNAKKREGMANLAQGQLTQEWLDENAPVLGDRVAQDFQSAIKIRVTHTEPAIYTELLASATQDGAEEAALSALATGSITHEDFARISAAQSVPPQGQAFRDQIVNELRPGQFDDAGVFSDALNDFDEFAANNQSVPKDAFREKTRTILEQGKKRMRSDRRASLPLPSTLVKARSAIKEEDIMTAVQRLHDRLASGKMMPEQAAQEAGILRQWLDLFGVEDGTD